MRKRATEENFSGNFLKEALMNFLNDKLYRGFEYYSNGEYTYKYIVNENF